MRGSISEIKDTEETLEVMGTILKIQFCKNSHIHTSLKIILHWKLVVITTWYGILRWYLVKIEICKGNAMCEIRGNREKLLSYG